jgi:hypothetical protein
MSKKNPSPIATKLSDKGNKEQGGAPEVAPSDEVNGYKALGLPEPTRYKDWEVKGRCSDF